MVINNYQLKPLRMSEVGPLISRSASTLNNLYTLRLGITSERIN